MPAMFSRGKQEKETQPSGRGAKGGADRPPEPDARQQSGDRGLFAGWPGPLSGAGDEETDDRRVESAPARKAKVEVETPAGLIVIENYCPAETLERMTVDDGIRMFSRNNPGRQKQALINVSRSEGGNVVSGVTGDLLVSYIGIHRPSETERWGKPGYDWLYEFGAIEVSRNYRQLKLAEKMLEMTFSDPFYDDKVMFTTGYTWHWDLEKTGLTKMEYHEMGVRLMGRFDFMEMATDEPNITMDSANFLLVRLGRNSTFSQYQKFASMLFTNEWEAMLRGF